MTEAIQSCSQLIALVGAAVLAALLARSLVSQLSLPVSTGYVLVGLTLGLFVAAAVGKVVGAGLPAAFLLGSTGGLPIGASMVPRAETFLIIMAQGAAMGATAVLASLFAAAVFVSLASCVLAPVAVQGLRASDPGLERAT